MVSNTYFLYEFHGLWYTSDINDRVIYRKITGHVLHRNYESVAYYNVNNGRMYIKSPDNYESVRFAEHDYAEAVDAAIEKYVTPDEKMELRKKYEIESGSLLSVFV